MLLAIIALATMLGCVLAADKKKKTVVFNEIYEFNEQMLLNFKFDKNKLSDIVGKYKYVGDVLKGKEVLSGEEGEFLKSYAANLGKTDAASQIDYLNERKAELRKYKEKSAEEYKKYSSLYLKVCIMIGILIAVLLA